MRDTIQNILRAIPGYEGYEAKEKRRDADKVLRTNLAQQYRNEQAALTRLAQKAVDKGRLEYLDRMEEINQSFGHFIARLESAPRGYASWFSDARIEEADLDQIYEFDAKLVDSIPLLQEQITYVQTAYTSGENLEEALDELERFLDGLHTQFNARQEFVAIGKRPSV